MKNTREVLLEVIKDVLERFAFMFTEAEEGASASVGTDDGLRATIEFRGKYSGILTLMAPRGLCGEMAANVLGIEAEQIGETAGEDTLRELLNIICGTVTWSLYGDREVFHLTVPVVTKIDADEREKLRANESSALLIVEGRPVLANLKLIE
ncbi:MAG TPA: chemotaxis protein CheX [Verrucomicrobiae bacterium]|nr:chemotaxis protein CheX [Verrucomicrobiae bacterium]